MVRIPLLPMVAGFLTVFALWTVLCNLLVLSSQNFHTLLYLSPLAALGGWKLLRWLRRADFPWYVNANVSETALFCLALLLAVFVTYLSHRADIDDAHFINMAVGVLDNPTQAMLKFDTMHGIDGMPIHLSNYRFHSYELLAALLAKVTSLPVIMVMHTLLPTLFSILSVYVFALLYQKLMPSQWALVTLVHVICLLLLCSTHRDYGNFGYVRLFQGKSILVTIMIPLIWWSVIQFFEAPQWRSWLLLCLSQVAAVGFTTNALFVAPLALGIFACAEWVRYKFPIRQGVFSLSAAAYPIMCAAVVLFVLGSPKEAVGVMRYQSETDTSQVFGQGWMYWLHWLVLCGAWAVVPVDRLRIFIVAVVSIVLLLNPLLAPYWAEYVTVQHNWRLLWAIPFVAMMAMMLSHLIVKIPIKTARVSCLLLLAVAGFLLPTSAFSPSNYNRISLSPIKVFQPEYSIAQTFAATVGEKKHVLAPIEIAAWLVTMEHHPFPLMVRWTYFYLMRPLLPPEQWGHMHRVQEWIDGSRQSQGVEKELAMLVAAKPVEWAVISQSNPYFSAIEKQLKVLGFLTEADESGYRFFHRASR